MKTQTSNSSGVRCLLLICFFRGFRAQGRSYSMIENQVAVFREVKHDEGCFTAEGSGY